MSRGPIYEPKYQTRTMESTGNVARGTAVKLGTSELQVSPVDDAADVVHGFLDHAGPDGDNAKNGSTVQIYREGGEAYGLAGGAIAKGALLRINATGRLVSSAFGNRSSSQIVGYALEAAAAAGELVRFNFTRMGY